MNLKNALDLGSLFTSGAGMLQASYQHDVSLEQEKLQHEEEIRQMKEQHQRELTTARQTYLLSAYTDIEQYFQELNENLINGSRDAERDMVDQRNQQFQTILIASTMMLTALLSILYQGQLPINSSVWFYTCYAVCTTASLLFLLISIFLGIMITSRVNRFMYKRSEDNISHLTQAMEQTKRMMRHIRGDVFSLVNTSRPATRQNLSNCRSTSTTEYHVRKEIVSLQDDDLEEEWLKHEEEVYKYLERRSRINERMELLAVDMNNQYRVSFQHYWNERCRMLANATLILFYTGTSLLLVTTMVYMFGYLMDNYNSQIAAIVAIVTIGSSLLISLALAVYLRYFDKSIELMRKQIHSETEREDELRHRTLDLCK